MLKISLVVFAIAACNLVHGYNNYGDNQQAGLEQQQQQQQVRGSFMRPPSDNSKWSSGFAAAPAESNQDGSYIIRPQFSRQSTLQQRNPNSRSESVSGLRSNGHNSNFLPNTGFVANSDLANNERANQRLLLPVSSGLPRSSGSDVQSGVQSGVSNVQSGVSGVQSGVSGVQSGVSVSLSKDVPQQSNVPLPKTEQSASAQQVPASGALPLSSLNRLRPQSHSSSPYYYRSETLEQMINRRSAGKPTAFSQFSQKALNQTVPDCNLCFFFLFIDKFLGPAFIQHQLISQKGDNKFLRVYGKEEKEINGTIEVKKGGLVNANLEEVKDGRFSVMDRQSRKVGDVQMHRDVEKHLKMTEHNGVTNVELEKNSNAELNVERDINLAPRIRPYGGQPNSSSQNPSHKIRVHLEQNQNSRANVEIAKNRVQQSSTTTAAPDNNQNNNGRFRRDTQAAGLPCNDC